MLIRGSDAGVYHPDLAYWSTTSLRCPRERATDWVKRAGIYGRLLLLQSKPAEIVVFSSSEVVP